MRPFAQSSAIRLVASTPELLRQALADPAALARALGARVPPGWVESRADSLRYTLARLEADPTAAAWWTYLLVYQPDQTLVGSGGYHGPPTPEGAVELGYEIEEAYQCRGLATAFAGALVARAFRSPAVQVIRAHTLAQPNASTRVLEHNGFGRVAELLDPAEGPIWQWELRRPAA